MLIMQLVEEGKLDLDEPISSWVLDNRCSNLASLSPAKRPNKEPFN